MQVLKGQMEDQKDRKAHREIQDRQVILTARQEILAHKALKGSRVPKAHKALRAHKVPKDRQA